MANVLSIIPEVWSSYSERGDRSWSPPAFTQAPGPGGPLSEFPLLDTLRSAHRPQQIGGDYTHVFFFLPFLRPLTDNANGISSTLGSTRAELFDILFAVAPSPRKVSGALQELSRSRQSRRCDVSDPASHRHVTGSALSNSTGILTAIPGALRRRRTLCLLSLHSSPQRFMSLPFPFCR